MEFSLVGIVFPLLKLGIKERIPAWNRMIITERSIPAEERLQNLLAVDCIFESEPNICVVIWGFINLCGHDWVPAAGRSHEFKDRRRFKMFNPFLIDSIDNLNYAWNECLHVSRQLLASP